MGTFIGHLVPGLAFTLLGIWHALNTTKSHKLHSLTHIPTWFPCPKMKHLELYLILSFSLLSFAFQFSGHHGPLSLSSLEHATMSLHLAIYAAAALFSDPLSPLVGVLAASAFGQELFLLRFHSTDHAGLEGHYHWLLQLAVVACFLVTGLAAGLPSSFGVAAVRSAAVTCQGVWFVVMGFALWVPRMVPEGCYATGVGDGEEGMRGAVECGSEEAGRRAAAMANLHFSWTVAGVLLVVVGVNVLEEWRWRWAEYRQLRCSSSMAGGGDHVIGGDDGDHVIGGDDGVKLSTAV